MVTRIIGATLLALCISFPTSDAQAGHVGPNYDRVPEKCVRDERSTTFDTARGGAHVIWHDRFNKAHRVDVGEVEAVTVVFPIAQGGTWFWFQVEKPRQQKTGFNAAVTWIEAVFVRREKGVRMQSTGFRCGPPAQTVLDEITAAMKKLTGIVSAVTDTVPEVIKKIGAAGASTVAEVVKIGTAAGLLEEKVPEQK